MKKILFILIFLFTLTARNASAEVFVSEDSAQLKSTKTIEDERVVILEKYLEEKNSPLASYAKDIIEVSDHYQLDWRLIPAIAGVESGFGKHIPSNSYNAYGWGNGKYSFNSWDESIEIVGKTLKERYIDRGAVNINRIAKIYAPPSNTWASKVKYFMNEIDPLPLTY